MVRYEQECGHWVLWQDEEVRVVVQYKTNFPAEFGGHLVVEQKLETQVPYQDYRLFAKMSVVAAVVQKGLEVLDIAPHANIQSNANWAFRKPDSSYREVKRGKKHRSLHLHVYGRHPNDPNWAEPIRPAYHKEQQEGKYWGKVFSKKQRMELGAFLEEEVPRALQQL